tara:strand:- start:7 stop:696 length:690 start_codon:yes stop_codon:yes gene_type:complete
MTKLDTKKIASDFTKLNTIETAQAKSFSDNLPFYLEIKKNMDFRANEISKYDDKEYLKKNKLKNKQVATQLFDDSIGYRKIISTKKDGSFEMEYNVNQTLVSKIHTFFTKCKLPMSEIQRLAIHYGHTAIPTMMDNKSIYGIEKDKSKVANAEQGIKNLVKKASSEIEKSDDEIETFELPSDLEIKDIAKQVNKYLNELLKVNGISNTQYETYRNSIADKVASKSAIAK